MDTARLRGGFGAVWDLIRAANAFIEDRAPWALNKAGDTDAVAGVLGDCLESLRIVALLASPVIPNAAAELWRRLGLPGRPEDQRLPEAAAWGLLPAGAKLEKGDAALPAEGRPSERAVWVDSHCHLQLELGETRFDARRGRRAGAARACGGRRVDGVRRHRPRDVAAGDRPRRRVIDDVYATVGLHPHDASQLDAEWDDARRARRSPTRCVAIGEARLRPPLRALAARRAGDRVPPPDPAREDTCNAADDPLAQRVGRHVPRARRRRRSRAHDLPLLHRRSRRSARARSTATATCRSAASCRSRPPTTCAPRPRSRRPTACWSRPTSPYLAPVPHRGKPNEPAFVVARRRRARRARAASTPTRSPSSRARTRRGCSASSGDAERDPGAARREHGVRPSKALGQNFLADTNMAAHIVRLAERAARRPRGRGRSRASAR